MPERVVVVLEAVEVEQQKQRRPGRCTGLERASELGGEPAAIPQTRQGVRHRLLANGVVGDDLGGGELRLGDQLGDQRNLVVLEGASGSHQPEFAGDRTWRGVDSHGNAQLPLAVVRDLDRARGQTALDRHRGIAHADRELHPGAAVREFEAPGRGVESLNRAMKEDFEQAVQLELGGERVPEPSDRRLQARPLLLDQLQAPVGLIDALAAVPCELRQEEGEREHEHDRSLVIPRGQARQKTERRQARIDAPDHGDDAHLKSQVRDHSRHAHPRHRAGQVQDAARPERGGEER